MSDEFAFPARPADLESARCDLPLKCGSELTDVAGLDRDDADEFCERVYGRGVVEGREGGATGAAPCFRARIGNMPHARKPCVPLPRPSLVPQHALTSSAR